MKGLEEWNKKDVRLILRITLEILTEVSSLLGNTWYRIDLFPNFRSVRVSLQLDQVVDETLTTFITNIFRIVNDATKDDSKTGDFERFFFHSVELGYSLKVDDTIFEDEFNLCQYPRLKERSLETTLESDFIDNLKLNIVYKRDYDKYDDRCTNLSKGAKRFP